MAIPRSRRSRRTVHSRPPAAPSIDFGPQLTTSGVRAVDFVDASIASALGGDELTLMGWLDLDSEASGAGGNRLISTLRRAGDRFVGFELVQEGRALRLGVNAYADQQGAPLSDENLSGSDVVDGWTFFAVTYDARGTGQVTFYFGRAGAPASLDGTRTLSAGAIRTDPGQTLSLGNFPDDPERPTGGANSRVPRGKLFGVRAFRAVLGIDEIRCQERLAR